MLNNNAPLTLLLLLFFACTTKTTSSMQEQSSKTMNELKMELESELEAAVKPIPNADKSMFLGIVNMNKRNQVIKYAVIDKAGAVKVAATTFRGRVMWEGVSSLKTIGQVGRMQGPDYSEGKLTKIIEIK